MGQFRKKIYAAAGYNTIFMGPGRKEFDPSKPMRRYEEYLLEAAKGTGEQLQTSEIDEGIIGSFMSGRFLKQANLPGFLPFMIPALRMQPCTAVEGACGTGGRAIGMAIRSVASDLADTVYVAGFEMQNVIKSVYGADVLSGAAYYAGERKDGDAFFFPGIFAKRAGAYFDKYGHDDARQGMARWYELAIQNARKNPKAQEYQNREEALFKLGMTPPDPKKFIPFLNHYDCSKVSDGASSLIIASAEGLKKCGIALEDAIEIISIGEAEEDITKPPVDPTVLSTTEAAVRKAFERGKVNKDSLGVVEVHDCFTISGLLAMEAIGFASKGRSPEYVLAGGTTLEEGVPVNPSGGLIGFGHPTGATGVRQLVDLHAQLTGKAANQMKLKQPYGLMISMGGNDKTVTAVVAKRGK